MLSGKTPDVSHRRIGAGDADVLGTALADDIVDRNRRLTQVP